MTVDVALTIKKIQRRVVPLLMICYFAAYLDRVNLSFAALSMNNDLGITPKIFGAGAGIFFIGYVLFEVPSNLMLIRFGARHWFARIMVTWGLVSLMFAFVSGTTSFLSLRFLLGAAEAGFFPGVMLFLTSWFPSEYRARMIGAFAVALPASAALGAPVSGFILGLDGFLHLKGWQWLFILEAIPSLILGLVVLRTLVDSPSKATWLDVEERNWLESQLAAEKKQAASAHGGATGPLAALRNAKVWVLGFIYCGIVAANYGVSFFLPQIVRALGVSVSWVGILTALPFVAGALGMLWWGKRSDRTRERYWHLLVPTLIAVVALVFAALTDNPTLKLSALICAGFGAFANLPVFWTLPSIMLSNEEAPAGIAVVSSIGNVAGFAAPYAVGYFRQMTGSFASGLIALAVFIGITFAVAAITLRKQARKTVGGIDVAAKHRA
jgi:MFS family permease